MQLPPSRYPLHKANCADEQQYGLGADSTQQDAQGCSKVRDQGRGSGTLHTAAKDGGSLQKDVLDPNPQKRTGKER